MKMMLCFVIGLLAFNCVGQGKFVDESFVVLTQNVMQKTKALAVTLIWVIFGDDTYHS